MLKINFTFLIISHSVSILLEKSTLRKSKNEELGQVYRSHFDNNNLNYWWTSTCLGYFSQSQNLILESVMLLLKFTYSTHRWPF